MTNNNQIMVTKRNGDLEAFNPDKLHKVLEWACEDISGVSISEIEMKANIQLYNKIPAYDIHELLVKSASELITEAQPNYQQVAGRLLNYKIRKEAYGQYQPKPFLDIINDNIKAGHYDKDIISLYTKEEFDILDNHIKHNRDDAIMYVGMEQIRSKYLLKDYETKQVVESPQIVYMLISLLLFSKYSEEKRLQYVKDYYDAISQFYISLPTPILAGLRTPTKQFSSCVLIECADSLNSITSTSTAVVQYISKKAGIGLGLGSIRGIGAKVREGSVTHTGLIPFLKLFQASVKSCSQGGVRGGAATVYYPMWHYEFEDLIVLKNNTGTEENRVRGLDYGVQINKLMYERLMEDGNITLFSPDDVPELYDSFFNDQDKFKELYEKYERKTSIRKRTLKARDAFEMLMIERKETGRIYVQHVDHANTHSSFDEAIAPIRMSNLCLSGDTVIEYKINTDNKIHKNTIKDFVENVDITRDNVLIKSKNIHTGDITYAKVTNKGLTDNNANILEITDESTGKSIKCSPDHRIYTKNRGYVNAENLKTDDILDII